MCEIVTFCLYNTDFWGYEFYSLTEEKIGSVVMVFPQSEQMQIESEHCHWSSWSDKWQTLAPGMYRLVLDNSTGEEVYRLIYRSSGEYLLKTEDGRIMTVEIQDDRFCFRENGGLLLATTERIQQAGYRPRINRCMDVEARFKTTFQGEVTEKEVMMVLSFPTLKLI